MGSAGCADGLIDARWPDLGPFGRIWHFLSVESAHNNTHHRSLVRNDTEDKRIEAGDKPCASYPD